MQHRHAVPAARNGEAQALWKIRPQQLPHAIREPLRQASFQSRAEL
jgi:hypothetical protein